MRERTNVITSPLSQKRYIAAEATHPDAPQPNVPASPGTGHNAFHTDRNGAAAVPLTKHADSPRGGESESSPALGSSERILLGIPRANRGSRGGRWTSNQHGGAYS